MLFNSLVFVGFFALVWPLYLAVPGALRKYVLLSASLVFYGWWDLRFLGLLVATSTFDWALGRAMGRWSGQRHWLAAVSVVTNLLVLATFKYYNFFAAQIEAGIGAALGPGMGGAVGDPVLPVLAVVLPAGISFYTFQAIGFSVDIARGRMHPIRRLDDFLLFISFFPHLVAGPIQRAANLAPQLLAPRRPTPHEVSEGIMYIAWGAFKKVVVADNLAPLVATGFDRPGGSGFDVVLAAYAFTLQIYGDFSGYSDIARGLARLFGVSLIQNFDVPLYAASPRELWHRWHISLSQWLRDYLYIPLGGSRGAAWRAGVNVIVTMLLGGLWHGANWTFVLWGAWHGVALAIQRALGNPEPKGLARLFWTPLMFHFTVAGFVIFRVAHVGDLGPLLTVVYQNPFPTSVADYQHFRLFGVLVAPLALIDLWLYRRKDIIHLPGFLQPPLAAMLIVAVVLLGATTAQTFIYFQF
ncbi:MAG: MBOAT family protein [Myxococcales bacterium]|nr:MBOAT family protein [Myxococcales bacterium]